MSLLGNLSLRAINFNALNAEWGISILFDIVSKFVLEMKICRVRKNK